MVRLLTKYNRKLNEKVFVLTGEEDYARTTETLLEMLEFSDSYDDLAKYRIGFKINVLRDKGDSTFVTLYDRDEVLGVFDWSQDYGNGLVIGKEGGASSTNPLNHGYDMNYSMEHDFYVKFSGNKKCLPSESAHISQYVEATNETRIDWLVNPDSTTGEGTLTVDIGLICGDLTLTREKPVKFYIDDVYDGASDTNEYSVAEYTFTGLEGGHHTVKAVFEGDEVLLASENSYTTISGYKLTFQGIPSKYINGQNVPITVVVTDYDGHPLPYREVELYDDNDESLGVSGIADENGLVKLLLTVNSPFKAKYGAFESELIEPVWVSISDLIVSFSKTSNYSPSTVTVTVSDWGDTRFSGLLVPIIVQSVAGSTTTNYITDNDGFITIPYNSEYVGDVTVSTNIEGFARSTTIEDNILYISYVNGVYRPPEVIRNPTKSADKGGFYINEEILNFNTYANDMSDCELSMIVLNDSAELYVKSPQRNTRYSVKLDKNNVLRISPSNEYGKFNIDVGRWVGTANERWDRKHSNVLLKEPTSTSNVFTIVPEVSRLYFNELKIKRVK